MSPFEEEKRVLENTQVPMFLMKCKTLERKIDRG